MSHPLDIPAFLIIDAGARKAAWRGVKITRQGSAFKPAPTKQEEAATRKLRREIEAQEKARREARFAALRAMKEARR